MDTRTEKIKAFQEQSWNAMYEVARAYYVAHGDLAVPSNYVTSDGKRLGPWINNQRLIRSGKKSGNLDEDRIRRLDAIGMSWIDLGEERWNRNFRALRAYYDRHGNIDVPQDYVTSDGVKLGRFVKNMRFHRETKYRRCLTPGRVAQLNQMGMIWDMDEHRWQQNYAAAELYYREHGNLQPTKRYVTPDGCKLGTWLAYQRRKFAEGELTKERITKLNAIGMEW